MKSSSLRSIAVSRALLWLFAALVAMLDWAVWPIAAFFRANTPFFSRLDGCILALCLYLCNAPAFGLLHCMARLLGNLKQGEVFIAANVQLLGWIARCCFAACAICLISCIWVLPLGIIAIAAGFMGLIVRIVRDVFAQAVPMRAELDLTV